MTRFTLVIIAIGLIDLVSSRACRAAEPPTELGSLYSRLVGEYIADIKRIDSEQSPLLRPYQSARLVCFTGQSHNAEKSNESTAVRERRQAMAKALLDLAQQALARQDAEFGYRLIWESHYHDSKHEDAVRWLEIEPLSKPKIRAATNDHPQFGWKRGRHWTVTCGSFSIETNHSPKAALELLAVIEELHIVWKQTFFHAWTTPEKLATRVRGGSQPLAEPRTFRIVLFRDREEYARQLRQTANAGISSGVYLDEAKFSALYSGDESVKSTWRHEITHQLLQEYLQAPPGVAKVQHAWLVEAAALVMESWQEAEGYITLGGWDAPNLQFARFRAFGGDFHLPLRELDGLGREALQTHAEVRKIYSEMSGWGQYFLARGADFHANNVPRYREAFLQCLYEEYRSAAERKSVWERIGLDPKNLDRGYFEFLQVTDADLIQSPPASDSPQLSLRRTRVTDAGLKQLSLCQQLEWLDLSFTAAGDATLQSLPTSPRLKQLFLEQTKVTSASSQAFEKFPALQELYLSNTAWNDDACTAMPKLPKLNTLDLTGCPVTDEAIDSLMKFTSLKSLDVRGTKITSDGKSRLKKRLPQVQFTSEN